MRCSAGFIKEAEENLNHITKTGEWKNKGGANYDFNSKIDLNRGTGIQYYYPIWILSDRGKEQRDAINVLLRQMYFSFLGPALWRQL